MKLRMWALILIGGITTSVFAASTATVVRDTELKTEAKAKSRAVVTLKKATQVEVKARQGGWYHVEAQEKVGWVKMFLLRFNPTENTQGQSGLGALLASTNKPHSNVTMTTGVRGITQKGIKNAKPNFVMLGEMSTNRSNKKQASNFAKAEKLESRKAKYVKQEKKK